MKGSDHNYELLNEWQKDPSLRDHTKIEYDKLDKDLYLQFKKLFN